jgi:hypothetical protein
MPILDSLPRRYQMNLATMIHPETAVGWRGRSGHLWFLFPGSGDNGGPADGLGGLGSTGFHGPRCSFLDSRDGLVLVREPAAGH